ncbi:hypothetical protein K2X05_13075 [bacterium]|nr:hypothetical protein [bacterium]
MQMLVFIFLLQAQTEIYSPEKYIEQTKHCHFSKLKKNLAQQSSSPEFFLDSSALLQMRTLYPLSSPWIKESQFLEKLGEVLYKNEANCKTENLTHWGASEDFPSLGLPHAIWYGVTDKKKYEEQFPELIRFIRKNIGNNEKTKISWPLILQKNPLGPAPWKNKEEFSRIQKISIEVENTKDSLQLTRIKNEYSSSYKQAFELFEIRHFLSNPIVLRLQAQFVVEKTFLALHRILNSVHKESPVEAQIFYSQIQILLSSKEGILSLVDYLNFKGEGLKNTERTPLEGYFWGLKAVLEIMQQMKKVENPNQRFAQSALCSLQRLAYYSGAINSPEQSQRYTWLNGGWKTRVESNYLPGTFENSRCANPKPISQTERQ